MNYFNAGGGMMGGYGSGAPSWAWSLMPVLMVWTVFWKGLALWHSAGRKQGLWFVGLLLINTVGILELVYLFGVLKLKTGELFPKRV